MSVNTVTNLYLILGVSIDSTQKELRKAYLSKAIELHPDRNKDDVNAGAKFIELFNAYEILKDEELRKKHDSALNAILEKQKKLGQEDENRKLMRKKLEENEKLAADRFNKVPTQSEDSLAKVKLAQEVENLRKLFRSKPANAKLNPYDEDLLKQADLYTQETIRVEPSAPTFNQAKHLVPTLSVTWHGKGPTDDDLRSFFKPFGSINNIEMSTFSALVQFASVYGLENALAFAKHPGFVLTRVSAPQSEPQLHETHEHKNFEKYEQETLERLKARISQKI